MRSIALALWIALLAGAVLVFATSADAGPPHRLSVRAMHQPRLLLITVTLHDVDARYRWLSVYGCAAAFGETGVRCTYLFERESSLEIDGRKHHVIAWRDLPRGSIQITVVAFDGDHRRLASGQTLVLRGV